MAEGGEPPGGHKKSWADVLGSTLPPSWNKNILEIILEKDQRGPFVVSQEDCAKLLTRIGINIAGHIEAVQICPNGRGVIFATLKNEVSVDKFINYDVIEVNRVGVRAVHVKPAGKREVVITIRGLHPNTNDQGVLDYLSKFGKVVTPRVIHCVYGEGPLKGVKNGDRSFKMELKPSTNISTYHVLFGSKVTLKYPGQKQTCARCFLSANHCPGGGLAKKCEIAGGQKIEFSDYILDMWKKIGHNPADVEVATLYDDHGYQEGGTFTPTKVQSEPNEFKGVILKNIPKESDHGDIFQFLHKSGLPLDKEECVEFKENGTVTIKGIENSLCLVLVKNLHNSKFSDKKLHCNGFIPLTPVKVMEDSDSQNVASSEQNVPPVGISVPTGGHILPPNVTAGTSLSSLERQKSVKELVTDFSSCISSSEEDTLGDWSEAGGSRGKKSRRRKAASTSPLQQQPHTKVSKV